MSIIRVDTSISLLRRRGRAAFVLWVALYTLVVLAPLASALIGIQPGRGLWINVSIALGYLGITIFGLQFLLASRSTTITRSVGIDLVMGFHREISFVAAIFVFAHPIILFLVDSRFLTLLNVFTSPLRAKFAVASIAALVALIVLSVFRRVLRIRYPVWQATHAFLAVAVALFAVLHMVLVGYYLAQPVQIVVWSLLTLAFVYLGVWERLIQPFLRHRDAWFVEDITADAGDSTHIRIRPLADDADGFRFEAGQFAWLLARRSPFSMTYHPFSISSSAERVDAITFTIKAQKGFSRDVARLQIGDRVYLDGPFGAFVLPESGPLVLIAAGVGVTPFASMLETLADRGDRRACQLWLGNHDENSIPARAQLEALTRRLDLTIHHVLSAAGEDWTGARGRLDGHRISRLHEQAPGEAYYFICGPDAMMDATERMLVALGVSRDRIHSERFAMV